MTVPFSPAATANALVALDHMAVQVCGARVRMACGRRAAACGGREAGYVGPLKCVPCAMQTGERLGNPVML